MENSNPGRRKILLINPRFQLSFIGFTLAVSMATTAIFYGAIYYFFWRFRSLGLAVGLPPDHVFFRFIDQQQVVLNWGFVVVTLVAISVLVLCGLYMSHRVAGPLYRLLGHMKRVAAGETTENVKFREKDYFQELADAYNAQLQTLREAKSNGAKKDAA